MPAAGDPDPTSAVPKHITDVQRPAQASQGQQGTQGNKRGPSNQSGLRRTGENDALREEQRSKGSNSDRDADESSRTGPSSAAPAPPEKTISKHKETTRRDKDLLTRERQGSDSSSSFSDDHEHIGRHLAQVDAEEMSKADPSHTLTTDESRTSGSARTKPTSTAQSQVAVSTRPPRSAKPEARPSTNSTSAKSREEKLAAEHSVQPPQAQGPGNAATTHKTSYASKVTGESVKVRGPSRADDLLSGPYEEVADKELQLPGGLPENDIAQQVEQIDQVQQPQPQQGEGKEGQSYAFGISNAFRSLMPTSGPSPPRDKTKEDLQKAMAELNYLRMDHKRAKEEIRGLRHACYDLDHERARLKDTNNSLQHELSNVQRELDESKALSETRGRELVGAQVFLTKADSLSISDVTYKVGTLNDEIFQASASLAETLVHGKHEVSIEDMPHYYDQACRRIGEPMVKLLINQSEKPEPEANPLIVQAVLSILLVGFCVSKLDSWYPADKSRAEFLAALYKDIRVSEEQAVSGRWRALTRSRTRPTSENWMAEVIEHLRGVLIIASWDSPPSPENQSAFEQKLVPIFKAVEDLRVALGEKFTSADLEVGTVRSGSKFEPWMEDAYGDGRQSGGKQASQDIVCGTTGLGLKQVIIDKGLNPPERFTPVLPPKVVLRSTIREALEPPEPSRPSKLKKRKNEAEDGGDGGKSLV
ncbi:hypothetical protein GALMADRAFT_255647 [Galerina marginata CBS 339.88]|uniref:Uncharacterized protein n=1 Tax=Galerina marginata (strain CBS 339.88) TaxID=685588 RepID=A0A067SQ56_GALM3|nr:hypothetical protein GALMADRAFT_255647 [Galerina marginata CBS 339.88]